MIDNYTIRRIVRLAFTEGFIDDHTAVIERVIPPAVAIFIRGVGAEVSVCPLEENQRQCLNPLYEGEDGEIHLSTASCGGNLSARGVSLECACQVYNQEHSFADSVEGAQFSQVILIKREDYIKKFGL